MVYQKPEDLTEVFNRIENISSSDILEVANEILSENRLSTLIYR
jgi:predicted Zn-dependent peptidase